MDAHRYDETTQNLIDKIQTSWKGPAKKDLSLLKRLKTEAEETQDNCLSGFVYYSYAIYYYFLEDHERLLKNLKLAIPHLLQSNEKELLARSYNMFAIEAQKHGVFEVAYNYYGLAASLVEDESNSLTHAIIEANIGDLLISMGDTKKARQYLNKSLTVNKKGKEGTLRYQNEALININIGMCYIFERDFPKAKRIQRKVESNKNKRSDWGPLADLFYKIFRLHLAIADQDRNVIEKLSAEIIEEVIKTEYYSEMTREIYDLCHALIGSGELKTAKEMIDNIDKKQKEHSFYYLSMLFANVKVAYCKAAHKRKDLLRVYEERDEYSRKQTRVKKEIYHESILLMELFNKLREEEMRIREENLLLQKEAETDALTKLANRYAMNRNLEARYVMAVENECSFGVGIADIDDFKTYNDTHGHLKGDECLIAVGTELKQIADAEGLFVARYGGDEFVFIYEDKSDKDIRKIEKQIGKCGGVSLTHGFYNATPNESTKVWDYFVEADKRLYQKKKAKKER